MLRHTGLARRTVRAAVICWTMAAASAQAADLSVCITPREATAFSLRHLQSRLMVAGLACNQRDAYNKFVEVFRPHLADAGGDLIGYFKRSGGGQAALNRYVTELANVAGLRRAENPEGFCHGTWNTFLHLDDEPSALEAQAAAQVMEGIGAPALCAAVPNSAQTAK